MPVLFDIVAALKVLELLNWNYRRYMYFDFSFTLEYDQP